MKKKEIRWLSRDKTGAFTFLWRQKPMMDSAGYYGLNGNINRHLGTEHRMGELKRGGLSKITIERQY